MCSKRSVFLKPFSMNWDNPHPPQNNNNKERERGERIPSSVLPLCLPVCLSLCFLLCPVCFWICTYFSLFFPTLWACFSVNAEILEHYVWSSLSSSKPKVQWIRLWPVIWWLVFHPHTSDDPRGCPSDKLYVSIIRRLRMLVLHRSVTSPFRRKLKGALPLAL